MAFAPGVSIEYWQELAERHALALEQAGNEEDAPLAFIVSNNCDRAVEHFQASEDYEDGKLVKAL